MHQLIDLDPNQLDPHQRNLRTDVGPVDDLKASIETVGILQPLVVTAADEDGRYRIVIGHRRHTAAIDLGLATVPCIVAADEGEARTIVTMLAENVHRVGLTVSEEAEAYHQLDLLGWDADAIAKVTAKPAERIRQALVLHQLPNAAKQAADDGALTLDHVAVLSEFTDDPKALARILDRGATTPWGFRHVLEDERGKRDRRSMAERLRAELVLAGVKIVPRPKDWGYGRHREAEAATLVDADGVALDPEAVKSRPGFAAFVDTTSHTEPRAVIICTDPEAWGYTRTRHTSFVPDEERARRAAAEAAEAAWREALEVAAKVRRDFLLERYGTLRGAKKVYLDALRDTVTDPERIGYRDSHSDLVTAVAGTALYPAVDTAGLDRLTRMLVGRWLAAFEQRLGRAVNGWLGDSDRQTITRYLDRLVDDGYALSEAEQQLRDRLTEPDAEEADDEAETDDEADGLAANPAD